MHVLKSHYLADSNSDLVDDDLCLLVITYDSTRRVTTVIIADTMHFVNAHNSSSNHEADSYEAVVLRFSPACCVHIHYSRDIYTFKCFHIYNMLVFLFCLLIMSPHFFFFFFLNDPAPPEISPLPLHAPLPI